MGFKETQVAYLNLRQKARKKAIRPEEFDRQVAQLKFQDTSGTWWRIRENGQGWLVLEGSDWKPVNPPGQEFAITPSEFCSKVFVPAVVAHFKSATKTYVLTLLGALALNALLTYGGIVDRLGQFGWSLAKFLGIRGQYIGRILFWISLGGLIYEYISDVRKSDEGKAAKGIARALKMMQGALSSLGRMGWPGMLAGVAVGIVLCSVIAMQTLGLVLGAWVLTMLGAGYQTFFFVGMSLIWYSATSKAVAPYSRRQQLFLVLGGFAVGSLATVIMPNLPRTGYIVGAVAAGLAIVAALTAQVKPTLPRLGRSR